MSITERFGQYVCDFSKRSCSSGDLCVCVPLSDCEQQFKHVCECWSVGVGVCNCRESITATRNTKGIFLNRIERMYHLSFSELEAAFLRHLCDC